MSLVVETVPAAVARQTGLRAGGVLGCTGLAVMALAGGLLDDARVVDSLDVLACATIRASGHAVRRRPCPERRR